MTAPQERPTVHDRLVIRLRAVLPFLPANIQLRRCFAGSVQRGQGAWSWAAFDREGADLKLGSQYPMKALLASDWLVITRIDSDDLVVEPLKHSLRAGVHRIIAIG